MAAVPQTAARITASAAAAASPTPGDAAGFVGAGVITAAAERPPLYDAAAPPPPLASLQAAAGSVTQRLGAAASSAASNSSSVAPRAGAGFWRPCVSGRSHPAGSPKPADAGADATEPAQVPARTDVVAASRQAAHGHPQATTPSGM